MSKQRAEVPTTGLSASLEGRKARLDADRDGSHYTVIEVHGLTNGYGGTSLTLQCPSAQYPNTGAMNIILGELVWRINAARELEAENKRLLAQLRRMKP